MKFPFRAISLGVVVVVALASMLVHPYGPVKAAKSSQPLFAGAEVDPAVLAAMERSCRDCHSEKTEWPWYSYVAPVSWMVEKDVGRGRARMNLSRWSDYTIEKRQELLTVLAAAVRSRQMPPSRYTLIHRASNLSPEERERIYRWADAERRRLKATPVSDRAAGQ